MNKHKKNLVDRMLAFMLAFVLVFNFVPLPTYAATTEHPDVFTIHVQDDTTGAAVQDASVSYEIKDISGNSLFTSNEIMTDEFGDVVVTEMSTYENEVLNGEITITYTVKKDGYEDFTVSDSAVTDVKGGETVTLTQTPASVENTVTIAKTGSGVIKIDGTEYATGDIVKVTQGSTISIEVTPTDENNGNTYIRKLSITKPSGTPEEIVVADPDVSYTMDSYVVEDDITISAEFVTEYKVSAETGIGGTVSLQNAGADTSETELTVDEGETVTISVNPKTDADARYQIASVIINGVAETVSDVTSFTKDITVTENVNIKAEFARIYTLSVTYDSTQGTVTTQPECVGGSVVIEEGKEISISAVPNPNYRVLQVVKNGVVVCVGTQNGEEYHETITAVDVNKDYSYEIQFALNTFKVEASPVGEGTVELDVAKVDYDGTATAAITPHDNTYKITGILIKTTSNPSGTPVDLVNDAGYVENEDNSSSYTMNNITEDTVIEVTFEEIGNITSGKWSDKAKIAPKIDGGTSQPVGELKDSYTDENGNEVYVYSNDTVLSVEAVAPYNQMNLKFAGETKYVGWKKVPYTINQSCEIESLQVRTGKHGDAENVLNNKKIVIVIDKTAPELTLTPDACDVNDYYNNDFEVMVSAKDADENAPYAIAGIATIEYWVTCDGTETQHGVINASGEKMKEDTITVIAKDNNSDNVGLKVTVTDMSGNQKTVENAFKVNCTKPVIKVETAGTAKTEATAGYYATKQATITIQDRTSAFDKDAALAGIEITAKDAEGKKISVIKESMISSEWNTVEGATPDEATHTATITFDTDANYEWTIGYTNKAGLSNEENSIETTGEDVWKFTVDTKAPEEEDVSIAVETSVWNELLNKLTFGVWKNYSVTSEATAKDKISPVYDILYYKANTDVPLTAGELEALYSEKAFTAEKITVSVDEAFVVYARITDYAGNTMYISTNGVIVDLTESEITLTPEEANQYGFYNKDIDVEVYVNENAAGKDFAGIKSVDYKVEADGAVTQEGNLYTFDAENPENAESGTVTIDAAKKLTETYTGNITVDKTKNNSDKVVVTVIVEDNAGNVSSEHTNTLAINTTPPEVKVSFEDEANKVVDVDGEKRGYFGQNRVAVITVKDRNSTFDADAAAAAAISSIIAVDANGDPITKTVDEDGKEIAFDAADMISEWTSDGDVHTATVTFSADANYTWNFAESLKEYKNKADLYMDKAVETEGTTPDLFTVDKEAPTGTITVNDNIWDKLLEILTFGLYSNIKADVDATAEDPISPVVIEYFKTSNPIAMSGSDLDKEEFQEFVPFSISTDEQFVIYLKLSDYAGNYTYIGSDGYIVDKVASEINIVPDEANENGVYNSDVNVNISIEDAEPYAGIKTVEYWVVKDGDTENPTQHDTLYTFDVEKPTQSQLIKKWDGSIVVESEKNNSCNVEVFVKTVDNAGNENTKSVKLDIDVTAPEIAVSYDNNNDNAGNGYFNAKRTATVTIKERTHHFDGADATKGIEITAVDSKGKAVEIDTAKMISSWTTVEGTRPDEAVHTATISYTMDANYTFAIAYKDKADNDNKKPVNTGTSVSPYKFAVDKIAPTGTVTAKTAEGREDAWSELVNRLTFGIWSNSNITITAATDDATSPVANVEYYKTSDTTAKTGSELAAVTEWKPFDTLSVMPNEQFAVYLKITDKAGNISYISTNGMIVDNTAPRAESIAPEITVLPQQPINDIYNGDVKVAITVEDPLVGDTYSGLKTISYRVLNMEKETQSGVLYSFENASPTQSELQKKWLGEITVDSELNNSNDVVIEVYAEDNSRNSSTENAEIQIDVTKPEINISYNNNTPDSEKYYKEARVATVVVTERNFDPKDVVVTITNEGGAVPAIGEWTKAAGSGNADNTTHTASITYAEDGDYTFDIEYTDLAGNKCDGETYAEGTVNQAEFTIDTTMPEISVSYDNNSALNESYFKESRTATVTVTEHNFDVSRVEFVQTASLDGAQIANPTVSWSDSGDTHTATIHYDTDGDYTFDVTMQDMAGNENTEVNYGSAAAAKEFTVDTNIVEPEITGVENGKAYKAEVAPAISFSDINYSDYTVTLTRTRMSERDVDVTEQFIQNMNVGAQGGTGTNNTFEMIQDNDGIYTLTVTMQDKAGNETETSVVFTLNRFGSVYVYSDYLISLIENGGAYVQAVKEDLVITEYNADRLVEGSPNIEVTQDGKPLDSVDYNVTPEVNETAEVGSSGWFQYGYTIDKDNFSQDGIYKLSVSSKDATGNLPENTNYEDKDILFRVDSTAPELTSIVGLEEKIINATQVDVKYTVYDTIGLKSVKVYVDDMPVGEEIVDFAGDYNNYSGSFTLKESGSAQNVRIAVEDLAGNVTDTDSENFASAYIFNRAVTVSTNIFVRWFANKALFWGSIGGTTAVIAAGTMLVVWKRRKKTVQE